MYAVFVDLEKAYDRVDRAGLWLVMRQYGVTGRLLEAVKGMYEGCRASVRMGGMREYFKIDRGVRQGCVMSPWLFNLYMDACAREVRQEKVGGIKVGDEWVNMLMFADDTVLLAESETDLQCLLDRFELVCRKRKFCGKREKDKGDGV